MAFIDGLHNKVNVKHIKFNNSNRKHKLETKVDESELKNIRCRIIDNDEEELEYDAKALFTCDIHLNPGDTITDQETNLTYTVIKEKKVHSLSKLHHITYLLKRAGMQ